MPAVRLPVPPPPALATAKPHESAAKVGMPLESPLPLEGVDRWTEGLRAAGEHDRLAERIEAIGRLTRGQVGEALRSLRSRRDEMTLASPAMRAQGSLALGLGLASANRPDEALLAGLDALARAREGGDARAAAACLAFLAKLYGRAQRKDDAAMLSAAASG
jgi:hypothetical protein